MFDGPPEGFVLPRRVVWVQGWALPDGAAAQRVDVLIDDAAQAPTRISVPRPDVAEQFDTPEAHLSGFLGFADLSDVPAHRDQVEIAVVVHVADGRQYSLGTRRYQLEPTTYPKPSAIPKGVRPRSASRAGSLRRLLVFTHDLGRAGSQELLLALLRHLAKNRGVTGTVVAPAGGATRQAIEDAGFVVHLARDNGLDSADVYEARQEELVAWAGDQDFDLVMANALNSFPGIDVGTRLDLPTVWKINENYRPSAYWDIEYPGWIHPHAEARAAGALDAATILCVPRAARDLFGEPGRRVVSVLPAIDVDTIACFRRSARREQIRRGLGLPDDAVVLLVLGAIVPRKMQGLCAEAFALSQTHTSAILALVGDLGGPYADGLRRFVEAAKLSDRIRVARYTEDRFAWLAAADALLCPSQFEGLPLAVLEALAFELPVVASAVGELPSIIQSGETGLLIGPCDLEALANGIDWAVGLDQAERAALGQAGMSLVRSRHALPEYVDSFTKILDEAYTAHTG